MGFSWRLATLPLAALIGLVACVGSAPRQDSAAEPSSAAPGADAAAARARLLEALSGLELAFTDPRTQRVYHASGPFEVVSSGADSVLVEGWDESFQTTSMRLFLQDGALWVLAHIDGREFLTRLQ